MPGLPFNRLPASGPMAQQAEQEFKATMRAAGEEFEIERRALGQQVLTDAQYQNKMAQLHGKHSLQALKMNREWNQRMTQINEYEKLGAAGTISPGQADTAQYGLSGYRVPKQTQPNYWAEHRNLIQERERILRMNDEWDFHRGKWKRVESIHQKGKRKGQVHKRGRNATPEEVQRIEAAQALVQQLDTYEFALLEQLNPQQRKVNQLSRAMAMGPRVQATVGVGGKRMHLPLGEAALDGKERERFETPGYKMTREKAIQQAMNQLGSQANKERVMVLAKQIYGRSQ